MVPLLCPRGISAADFTGKFDHLWLPEFNFIQVTMETAVDPAGFKADI